MYKRSKYDKEISQSHLQNNPQLREEETQTTNNHMTSRSKYSISLNIFTKYPVSL